MWGVALYNSGHSNPPHYDGYTHSFRCGLKNNIVATHWLANWLASM